MSPNSLFSFSGQPAVLDYGHDVQQEMLSIDAHLQMLAKWMTSVLRERARADSNWADLAPSISIEPTDDGGFAVSVSGEHGQRAHDLEYGSAETAPAPLLRSTLAALVPQASMKLTQMLDLLGGAL